MLTIIAVNFSNDLPWLFKLTDSARSEYYIMSADFYERNGRYSPITKHMLDSLDVGYTIKAHVENISGFAVVTEIRR